MCGIGGIVGTGDGDRVEAVLHQLTLAMRHRGPDDAGTVVPSATPAVGMCVTRLAIQDLSRNGHQPMVSPRSGTCIAFNGELYNVRSLRATLKNAGWAFRGRSDTEVALAAYETWGPECVGRFRGMFALAVWDAGRRHLYLARDRLGIKPLYYSCLDRGLVFASELTALLATGLIPPRLSIDGLRSYLETGAVVEPETIVQGVRMLPPGHYATLADGAPSLVEYWSLENAFARSRDVEAPHLLVREKLEEAVDLHLVGDVPVAIFLSGGIDSSTLAGLVAGGEPPPTTLSVVFPQEALSERRHARATADRLGTRHHEIQVDDEDAFARLPAIFAAMDQPTVDGVNTFLVAGATRDAGLKVALSGLGADELFAGYPTFANGRRLERLRHLTPGPLGRLGGATARLLPGNPDRAAKLSRWLRRADPGMSSYVLQRELFSPTMRGRLSGSDTDLSKPPTGRTMSGDWINDTSYLELTRYMRNTLLRDSDVMSMAHGVELRVPFLDHELVELIAGLDGGGKVAGNRRKPLLVDAARDLIPNDVARRPKMGFGLPFELWLRDGLRVGVDASMRDPDFGGQAASALDATAVHEVWESFLEGKTQWSRPWSLYVIKRWAEHHLPA